MIIWLTIATIVFAQSILKKNSKILFLCQLIIMWFFLGWNSGGIDYFNNEQLFYWIGNGNVSRAFSGWLLAIISRFFQAHSLSYLHYNILSSLIGLIIIAYLILKNTENCSFVANWIFIFPFINFIIQKRFFMGIVFILLALYALKNKRFVLYVISVLLAVGFHFAFIIFIPIIFWMYLDRRWENRVLLFCGVLEILFLHYGMGFLSRIISSEKLLRYTSSQIYSSPIVGVIYAITQVAFIYISLKMFSSELFDDLLTYDERNFIFKINKLSLLICPLLLFESAYFRYYRIPLIFNYIYISRGIILPGEARFCIYKHKKWVYLYLLFTFLIVTVTTLADAFGVAGYLETLFTNSLIAR